MAGDGRPERVAMTPQPHSFLSSFSFWSRPRCDGWGKSSSPGLATQSLVSTSAGPLAQRTVPSEGQLTVGWNVRDKVTPRLHGRPGGRSHVLPYHQLSEEHRTVCFPSLECRFSQPHHCSVSWVQLSWNVLSWQGVPPWIVDSDRESPLWPRAN